VSNHLAVATVTATLHNVLIGAGAVVPGTTVTTGRPAAAPPHGPSINAFLYQVTPNAAYRNEDLPTRRADGRLVQKPRAALALHYLFSFSGDEGKLEAQRLLGAVVRQLHAQPALRPDDITSTIGKPPFDAVLAASDLARQVDVVRLTPLNLSLDELSKMWSVFFQVPYLLSVAYQASAVLVETDDAIGAAVPVQERNVYAVPVTQPVIDNIVSAADENAPIALNATIAIRGRRLRDTTQVLIAGVKQVPSSVSDTRVVIKLPAGITAGVHAVQVLSDITMGHPPGTPHRGVESEVAPVTVTPRIKSIAKATAPNPGGGAAVPALKLTLDGTIGRTQQVVLLLNNKSGAQPSRYSFVAAPRKADSAIATIPIPGVTAGTYFVVVQVDEAPSPVDLDPSSAGFGPAVKLP
jgi:hypothetical protein